jgi:hypothetical protein
LTAFKIVWRVDEEEEDDEELDDDDDDEELLVRLTCHHQFVK